MIDAQKIKKIKLVVTILLIILIVWFIILNPIIKFKREEKTVLDAAKRYFEINSKLLFSKVKLLKDTCILFKFFNVKSISKNLQNILNCNSSTSDNEG